MNDESTSTATNRFDPRHSHDGDLTNRFTYHAPEPEQPEVYQLVRDVAHLLAIVIEAATYPSPERDRAVVQVEQAVMWANTGIARRGLSGGGISGARALFDHALDQLQKARPDSQVIEDDGTHWSPVSTWERAAKDAHAALVDRGGVTQTQVNLALAALDQVVLKTEADPWASDMSGPVDFHEGKINHTTLAPLVIQVAEDGTVQVRNVEILDGRGVLVLPAGIDWEGTVAALTEAIPPVGGEATTDDAGAGTHPDHWSAVCPFCPTYICTEGRGAQRDAQEWLLDHAEQAHGKTLRS